MKRRKRGKPGKNKRNFQITFILLYTESEGKKRGKSKPQKRKISWKDEVSHACNQYQTLYNAKLVYFFPVIRPRLSCNWYMYCQQVLTAALLWHSMGDFWVAALTGLYGFRWGSAPARTCSVLRRSEHGHYWQELWKRDRRNISHFYWMSLTYLM